jgi:hypothetical protein
MRALFRSGKSSGNRGGCIVPVVITPPLSACAAKRNPIVCFLLCLLTRLLIMMLKRVNPVSTVSSSRERRKGIPEYSCRNHGQNSASPA